MAKPSQESVIAAMKAVPMFCALDEKALRIFVAQCRVMSCPAGMMIFGPSQKADRFFVIVSGRVKIHKISPRGDEQILHLYGQGESFGEAAMWAGINYPAFAEALTDAELVAISKQGLRQAVVANSEMAMGIIAGLSAKLREFNQLIEDLSLKDVPSRLAGVLLRQMEQGGSKRLILRQTKRQLAGQIGTIPETLSRALAKMKAEGIIGVKGSNVAVLDEDRLRGLAEDG